MVSDDLQSIRYDRLRHKYLAILMAPMSRPPPMDTEQTPLRKRTPLPRLQIWVILLLHVVEPITSQSIYPYINQVRSRRLRDDSLD